MSTRTETDAAPIATDPAELAGWDPAYGPAPFSHGQPPAVDPNLGNNGVAAPEPGDSDFTAIEMAAVTPAADVVAGVDLGAVLTEHRANVGWREGPNNANPWGAEQGIPNAAYCDSAASMVPYHHGYRWWPESQFGEKGSAYCPSHVNVAANHGEVVYDHASQGQPADVKAGDLLFYDWYDTGVADHVETAVEDCPSGGRTHNIGYNTGAAGNEGCYDLWRDRRYLLCRIRPTRYSQASPPPPPAPAGGPITMYDSVTAADIPANAVAVEGYVDGKYAWSQADWDRFPNAVKVRIAVFAATNDGHMLDCETGDATPAECPGWVAMRKAAGIARPVVYCNLSTWPAVQQAMAGAGQTCDYLIAHPTGKPHTFPGAVGCQYSWPNTGSGGHFDLNWVTDPGWMPGAPPPDPVPDNPGTGTFKAQHPDLSLGAKGDAVRHLQMCIGAVADGDFGPATEQAVINAQRNAELATDGSCGPDTWSHIHVTVAPGSLGEAVKEVQQEVGIPVDGEDGPQTTDAIRGFQQHAHLQVDGECGPLTYRAMFN